MPPRIPINQTAIADFCRRHHLTKLSLFGSVIREDFDPTRSDVDVLVEFEDDTSKSLFKFVRMQDELAEMFGYPAHVSTPGWLSKYFRDEVLAEAELLYDAPSP